MVASLDTSWRAITNPVASELIRLECLWTIDHARLRLGLDDRTVARYRADTLEAVESFTLVALDPIVLERAADPFPTTLGSLDVIHLASALSIRDEVDALKFATHDDELGTAARATGFEVYGVYRDG